MPFASRQPLSREVPEKRSLRRVVVRLRAKCVTGAILSLQLPPPEDGVLLFPHSVGPPVWVETNVPGSLPAAVSLSSLVPGLSFTLTAGHTTVGRHVFVSSATPHTSGERPQASPLTIPVTGPMSVHAPISSGAVTASGGMSAIRPSVTFGFAARPLLVWAAVMYQTGFLPWRATPVQ